MYGIYVPPVLSSSCLHASQLEQFGPSLDLEMRFAALVGSAALESWTEPALELKDATILVLERLDCAEELLTGVDAPDEETRNLAVVRWVGDTAVAWSHVLQNFVGRLVDALLGRLQSHRVD